MTWADGPGSFFDAYIQPGLNNYPVILASAFTCYILADFIFTPLSGWIIPQYKTLNARQKNEWNGRLVAMVHALFAITLCPGYIWPPDSLVYISNITGETKVNHYGFDAFTQFIFSISVGYFLWDSVVCVQHRWGFEYILHGVMSFLVYYINLFPFLHYWGRFYLGYFELSSIPLHFRGCMIMLGYNKDPEKKHLFMLAQNTWVAIYTVCRIFVGTHTTYVFLLELLELYSSGLYHSLAAVYISVFVVISMMLLMYYWFYQIIMGLLARGRQNDRRDNEDTDNEPAGNKKTNKNDKKNK